MNDYIVCLWICVSLDMDSVYLDLTLSILRSHIVYAYMIQW